MTICAPAFYLPNLILLLIILPELCFRFVCIGLYFPISISRFEIPDLYFTNDIYPNSTSLDLIYPTSIPRLGFSELCFPMCILCWTHPNMNTFVCFTTLDSFSSKMTCSFYACKKLHAFARACDVCTFNVHFCDNSSNGFESKRITFEVFHRWPISRETLYVNYIYIYNQVRYMVHHNVIGIQTYSYRLSATRVPSSVRFVGHVRIIIARTSTP